MGLVIGRKLHQRIQVGEAVVTVIGLGRRSVELLIDAPERVSVRRLDAQPRPIEPPRKGRPRV